MDLIVTTPEKLQELVFDAVKSLIGNVAAKPEADEIGGVELASRMTGKTVATIYTLTSKNLIPYSKRGNQLYFSKNDLLAWIRSGKRSTRVEIAATIN